MTLAEPILGVATSKHRLL